MSDEVEFVGNRLTPDQTAMLLRMGIARRVRPYIAGDLERIVELVAAQLVADLEAIGFELMIEWRGD